jgi:hypothetical protein
MREFVQRPRGLETFLRAVMRVWKSFFKTSWTFQRRRFGAIQAVGHFFFDVTRRATFEESTSATASVSNEELLFTL